MVNRVNMIVIVLGLILTKKQKNEKDQRKEMKGDTKKNEHSNKILRVQCFGISIP